MNNDTDPDDTKLNETTGGTTPRPDEDPIDADFEPAAPKGAGDADGARGGPGWLGVGVASAVAAGVGGLIGVVAAGTGGSGTSLSQDVFELVENQRTTETRLEEIAGEVGEVESRIQREVQALIAGDGDTAGLDALVSDLEALSARLDAAGTDGAGPDALVALAERVETLETADDNEAVSPRQMNRAVTAMRERVDAQEDALAEIRRGLDIRAEALAALTTRIATLEQAGEAGAVAEPENLSEDIAALRRDLDALRQDGVDTAGLNAALAEREASSEAAIAEADDRADAALALARIESRARRGQAFDVSFARLKSALPDVPAVDALQPIAATGAPTHAEIRSGFTEARETALNAAQTRDDGWNWVRNVFGDAVSVRREGEEPGPEAVLDTVDAALSDGDLAVAIAKAETVTGAPGEALSEWLDGAKRRRDLEDALESLNLAILRSEP